MNAVSYLFSRILDEMDGKQARKTGNSSPLGLMMDHGCDSFSTGFHTLMMLKVLQIGNNFFILFGVIAASQTFYISTLEEYYTGGLFLGLFNGVTDGSVLVIGFLIYCGFYGNDLYAQPTSILFGNQYMTIGQTVVLVIFIA